MDKYVYYLNSNNRILCINVYIIHKSYFTFILWIKRYRNVIQSHLFLFIYFFKCFIQIEEQVYYQNNYSTRDYIGI